MVHRNLRARLFIAVIFTLGLLPVSGASAQTANDATGWWLDQTGRAAIKITPCGSNLCGNIEWLRQPLDEAGQPKTDTENADPSLRTRHICGLPMMGNFSADGTGKWSGGWIYDPEKGKTYKSEMHLASDGTLRVRGYIGTPMLGRTETWTRPSTPLTPCASS